MKLSLELSAKGRVKEAKVSASKLGDEGIEACVTAAAQRWKFPASRDGFVVSAIVPFDFGS